MYNKITLKNNKTYTFREFNKIESNEDAYTIGYLLGDGGWVSDKNQMTTTSTDKYIMEYFINRYQPDHGLRSVIPVNKTRPKIVSTIESHKIQFSTYFTPTFEYYGITDLKPNRVYKNIPEEYMKAFILGFLDADGSVTCFMGTNGNGGVRFRTGITFTHPSRETLTNLSYYLKSELNVDSSLQYKKNENCSVLKISGNNDCYMFCRWINDIDIEIFNERKLNKRHELIQMYDEISNATKTSISGIRVCKQRNKTKYSPFVIIEGNYKTLQLCESYDEAVKIRFENLCLNFDSIQKNGLREYNPYTKQFEIKYINPQDNTTNTLHMNLQGEITKFEKL